MNLPMDKFVATCKLASSLHGSPEEVATCDTVQVSTPFKSHAPSMSLTFSPPISHSHACIFKSHAQSFMHNITKEW